MNQIFIAATGVFIGIVLFATSKKPKDFLSKIFDSKESVLVNNEPISLVTQEKAFQNQITKSIKNDQEAFKAPNSIKGRIELKKQLLKSMSSMPEQRLLAVKVAGLWGDHCVVPILRRGLKDSDSRVICAAAIAIEKFKTSPRKKNHDIIQLPPRNVSLMR